MFSEDENIKRRTEEVEDDDVVFEKKQRVEQLVTALSRNERRVSMISDSSDNEKWVK